MSKRSRDHNKCDSCASARTSAKSKIGEEKNAKSTRMSSERAPTTSELAPSKPLNEMMKGVADTSGSGFGKGRSNGDGLNSRSKAEMRGNGGSGA